MQNGAQVKAVIPRELKRQVFATLAAREETFSHWLRTQLAAWLRQVDATAIEGKRSAARRKRVGRGPC